MSSLASVLTLKVSRSIRSEDVIDTLAELFAMRGVPNCIRSDNGPEFVAKSLERWLEQLQVSDSVHRSRQSVGERV